jgi:hypothetical protein
MGNGNKTITNPTNEATFREPGSMGVKAKLFNFGDAVFVYRQLAVLVLKRFQVFKDLV